jgi:hypothetical protein
MFLFHVVALAAVSSLSASQGAILKYCREALRTCTHESEVKREVRSIQRALAYGSGSPYSKSQA